MPAPAPLTVTAGTLAVSVPLLVRVDMLRNTNRAAYETTGLVMAAGVSSPWTGTLVYLCATLGAAIGLASVYEATDATTPATITGYDADLDGWPHYLANDVSVVQDATLNGVKAPWIVTVPVLMGPPPVATVTYHGDGTATVNYSTMTVTDNGDGTALIEAADLVASDNGNGTAAIWDA